MSALIPCHMRESLINIYCCDGACVATANSAEVCTVAASATVQVSIIDGRSGNPTGVVDAPAVANVYSANRAVVTRLPYAVECYPIDTDWRCTPGVFVPFLRKLVSSMIPIECLHHT